MACPVLLGFDPTEPAQIADPYPQLARARAEQPVLRLPDHDLWCVTRYAEVATVLRDPLTYSNAAAHAFPPLPEAFVAEVGPDWTFPFHNVINRCDPPDHTRLRRLMGKTFTPRRVAVMEDGLRAFALDLIAGFEANGEVDVVNAYAWPITHRQIARLIGVEEGEAVTVHDWLNSFFALTGARPADEAETLRHWRNMRALEQWGRALLDTKRAQPGDDLISDLIRAAEDDTDASLSPVELVSNTIGLLIAGTSAPAVSISQSVYHLLRRPELWARVTADPALIPGAIEEVLRFAGPVRGLIRTTTRDVTLGEVAIPAGQRIYVSLASANRDETVFVDAAAFDAERANAREHLDFGRWAHFCLGAPLARLQVRIAIECLAERLPHARLADPDYVLPYSPSMIAPSPLALPVRWPVT
jgi:cytochrome P450